MPPALISRDRTVENRLTASNNRAYCIQYTKVLHGESNKWPASPRTTKTTAQSKSPTNQQAKPKLPRNNTTNLCTKHPTHHTVHKCVGAFGALPGHCCFLRVTQKCRCGFGTLASLHVAIPDTVVAMSQKISHFLNRPLVGDSMAHSRIRTVFASCQPFACNTLRVPRTPSRAMMKR